uniref:DUF1541 domain-containing protein n=1 Tax=Panagrolaimus superbus TaxID=310955 RepID=A0A914YHU4_9BILA
MSADHMKGMKDAEAKLWGLMRRRRMQSRTHQPQDHTDQPFAAGTEVVLNADHMPGMKGAKAIIDSAEQTTVYMVDYTPTTGGDPVKNHKWVTEEELSAK